MNIKTKDGYEVLVEFIEKRVREKTDFLQKKVEELEKQNRLAQEIADLVSAVRKQNSVLTENQAKILQILEQILELLKNAKEKPFYVY